MSITLKFIGGDKPMTLRDVESVKVFDGAKTETLSGESLKNLRVRTCADYIFKTPDKTLSVNAAAILWLVVD